MCCNAHSDVRIMPNRLSDPKWKSGPPEPKYSHSEHAIHPEDYVYDFDGPGRDEAEAIDGTIMTVVIEGARCSREGCDAEVRNRHCYVAEALSDRTQQALLYAIEFDVDHITDDVVAEYVAANALMVDHDGEYPIVGIQFDNDESYNRPMEHSHYEDPNVLGYVYPTETFTTNTATGSCHGRSEPPSHEPHGL